MYVTCFYYIVVLYCSLINQHLLISHVGWDFISSSSYGVVVWTQNMVPVFDLLQPPTQLLEAREYCEASIQLCSKVLELLLGFCSCLKFLSTNFTTRLPPGGATTPELTTIFTDIVSSLDVLSQGVPRRICDQE